MTLTVQIIAGALALAGLAGFAYGTDLLPTERGIAYTISSVVAFSAGVVTLALALVMRRLDRLTAQMQAHRPEGALVAQAATPDVAPPVAPAPDDQPELPLAPPPAAPEPPAEPDSAPAAPLVARDAPEPVPTPEPVVAPLPEPKRPRFRLPSFGKSRATAAAVAAGGVAGAAVAGGLVLAETQPAGGEGEGSGGNGTLGVGSEPENAPVAVEAAAIEVIPAVPVEILLETPARIEASAAPVVEISPAAGEPAPVTTQRPRVDFVPVDETYRPRKAEPPLAPPRLPRVAEPPVEVPEPAAEAPAQSEHDPFAALEAEFDRLIPLKPAAPVAPVEQQPDPYVEADVDRPDEALMIALSNEPLLSDGMRPEAPPPAPEPGPSPLRGGLAGPVELEERELAPPGVEVIGSYESGGARYTMYSDSSVVVEIDGKTVRFSSLEQLRDYIEAGSARG